MSEKRFTLEKDYNCDGNWEYCYQDNETGRSFNFADDNCDTDFLGLVNAVIDDLKKENKELKQLKTKCILNKQYEENQRLIKMLNNVANYMQKQHKDMPIDDFVEWWNNIATDGL